jgi:[acyl-carrier-protein] S-malonyltransferase
MNGSQVAFLFPGQGSQSVGMLGGFAGLAAVDDTMAQASEALGQDLVRLIADGPIEALALTVNTQPVMLSSAVAAYRAYLAQGGQAPQYMAGHSLGEYAALTAAGVFDLSDAVRAVRFRAQQMQDAVPVGQGTMAAVMGLAADAVVEVCERLSAPTAVVEAVNFNAPDQTVIAGHTAAIEQACLAMKEAGAKRAIVLPVSAPFHSSLLAPAARALRTYLADVKLGPPTAKVIHNVDLSTAADAAGIREALSMQAMRPVRWVETIELFAAQGVTHVVECGPGKVLAGLVKRISPDLQVLNISDRDSLHATLEALA